ncbi:uncharacterized protein LOC130788106 [Actinidia eriantha]|uniref:uncharacterized protein LOC130788106 n=1 Tax=Actinidia eriantha TaxID=165200 RepID=UPI00258AA84D|nr:uncharacterized protein LOC130788106 [Actinidia eriantha]
MRTGQSNCLSRKRISNVSVDYLTKPIDVFKEMCRILKPGGLVIMSFTNRCFWSKAISIWTLTGGAEHVMIVGSYFHDAGDYELPQGSTWSWSLFGKCFMIAPL